MQKTFSVTAWFLLLTFVIQTQRASASCDSNLVVLGEQNTSVSAQTSTAQPILAHLPEDLKPLMKAALLDTLDNAISSSWIYTTIREMKISGLFTPQEFHDEIERRLQGRLEYGRKNGLSTVQLPKLLTGTSNSSKEDILPKNARFFDKYNLARFTALVDTMRSFERASFQSMSGYKIGLSELLYAAKQIGDYKSEQEIFQHMLLLRDYERATFAAEKISADSALINIALFAIADYFRPGSAYYLYGNNIWYAIEALKRVTNPRLKPQANQILIDLAQEYLSDDLLKEILANEKKEATPENLKELRKSHRNYALIALRSTGDILYKKPVDSVRVSFANKVTDPTVIKLIKDLLKEIAADGIIISDDDVLLAATAIGETSDLQKSALNFLEEALQEKNAYKIGTTLETFAILYDRKHFSEAFASYLNQEIQNRKQTIQDWEAYLKIQIDSKFHYSPKLFGLFLYGLQKEKLTHAFSWMKEDLTTVLTDPQYQPYAEQLRKFLVYGVSEDGEIKYQQEMDSYLPPQEGMDLELYSQFVEEANIRMHAKKNMETREELIALATQQIQAKNGLNARLTILRAAIITPESLTLPGPTKIKTLPHRGR